MSRSWKVSLLTGALAVLWLARLSWDYYDPNSPANIAMQVQLKMFGTAMYEYHSHTGRWPTKLGDLAQTSLPVRSHVWRRTANTIVFLWPQNLNAETTDNASILLAYWNGGLFNRYGRVRVCWGDLRTERIERIEIRKQTAK